MFTVEDIPFGWPPTLTELQQKYMALYLAALRSGDYRQIQGRLRAPIPVKLSVETGLITSRGEGFCCLGVMTEVAIKIVPSLLSWSDEEAAYVWTEQPHEAWEDPYENSEEAVLPHPVGTLFGIEGGPVLKLPCGIHFVAAEYLNDELAWTFNQIADAFAATYMGEQYPTGARCPACNPDEEN